MIVEMKKVSVVVLDSERKEALKRLRKTGVLHLETIEGKGAVLASYKDAKTKAENTIGLLEEIKLPKKTRITPVSLTESEKVLEKCNEILDLSARRRSLLDLISADAQELERFSKWGKVNPADFEFLTEKDIRLSMYEIPSDKYALIPETLNTVTVNKDKSLTRFLLVSQKDEAERPAGLPPEAFEVVMPEKSSEQLEAEIAKAKKEIVSIDKEMISSTAYLGTVREYLKKLESDIEFETVYSGMGRESEEEEAGTTDLAWISGYVPVDSFEKFKATAAECNWAFASDTPADDDPVPTKLKNNKFVSLIYPLTDFLGTVPGYHEFDISGWFLLFFTVYFGMIFGDGGYGLLVTLAAIVLIVKSWITRKPVKPLFSFMLLLGFATVVWGVVTCTWFGLSIDILRNLGLGFLGDISVPVLSNAYSEVSPGVDRLFLLPWSEADGGVTTSQCLQIFCFTLALLQLSVAHIKCIIAHRKTLKVLGDIGSLLQIWGMFYVILMVFISTKEFPMDAIMIFNVIPIGYLCVTMLAVGFVMSFIFSNYEGSVKESILASCKNIISVLLGIVNVFSDILSYVRLWAVGLAGSAISGTVNNLASQIAGGAAGPVVVHAIVFVLVIVLIVFGHGLNMVLNLLSVIVHGVRLNTLEFSSHLGMEWSGIKYEPFSEKE